MASFNRSHHEGVLSRYVNEFCSPVVVTVTTAEVEATCLRNGLMLHELLSAFSQLDNINCSVRMSTHTVRMSDAHVRFERSSELKVKRANMLEKRIAAAFRDNSLSELPASVEGLIGVNMKESTGWGQSVEDAVMHSMSFDESEAISQPTVMLYVISSNDVDPVACMQELVSAHHIPTCLTSGQYDPAVTKVYAVLHDVSAWGEIASDEPLGKIEAGLASQKLKQAFPQGTVHLLHVNSLPKGTRNVRQPDIWSRWILPRWFSGDVHALHVDREPLPNNPATGAPALGCCLSMEDFVACHNFCLALFTQSVLPCLERRLFYLSKQVNDSKKGVKNFFKGFLRKPREEVGTSGLRYPLDRIESQTLLLADTTFMVGDYEGAAGHYRLARDDFKADRSTCHLMHCSLMLALCHCITDPHKPRDRREHLDAILQLQSVGHSAPGPSGPAIAFNPQLVVHYALLCSEMLICQKHIAYRSPLDAAHLLLQAAALYAPEVHAANKHQTNPNRISPQVSQAQQHYQSSLICALLHERAAACFLSAGRFRHFSLHKAVAGMRYRSLPPTEEFDFPRRQAASCFSSALLFYERGHWGGIKARLTRSLIDGVKERNEDGAKRACMLIIKALEFCINGRVRALSSYAFDDAVHLLKSLMEPGPWGTVRVLDGRFQDGLAPRTADGGVVTGPHANAPPGHSPQWASSSTRETLLNTLPLASTPAKDLESAGVDVGAATKEGSASTYITVEELSVPQVDLHKLTLMVPSNGLHDLHAFDVEPGAESEQYLMHKRMKSAFRTEQAWAEERRSLGLMSGISLPTSGAREAPSSSSTSSSSPPLSGGGGSGENKDSHSAVGAGEQDLARRFAVTEVEMLRATRKEALKPTEKPRVRVPMGEPVVLCVPLKNKLPTALALTEMQLDFRAANQDAFTIAKSTVHVPAKGALHALVSAVGTKLGTFEVPTVCWQLGALRVQRQLVKPGARLHATQEQRASKARAPSVLLCFDVIESHPLLCLKAESEQPVLETSHNKSNVISLSCLEGELQWVSLSIENQGKAPAGRLQLKTNRPFAVWYVLGDAPDLAAHPSTYDNARIDTYGQSGTIAMLPNTTTIAPGGVLRIGAYVRFPRVGSHRFNVLVTYSGIDSKTGDSVPFGPGPRCRTAFLPTLMTVHPSLSYAASASDCLQATPGVKNIQIEVRNSTTLSMPLPVNREVGADSGEDKGEGGSLTVTEVLSLGGARPWTPPSSTSASKAASSTKATCMVAPQESLSFCVPVLVASSDEAHVATLWPPKGLPVDKQQPPTEEMVVLCQLLGVLRANIALERSTAQARITVEEEERESASKGPKSIAQVRRENRALAAEISPATVDEDGFEIEEEEKAPPQLRGRSASVGWGSSKNFDCYVLNAAEIAKTEARRLAATLVVRWSAWREGRLRRGVHWAGSFPLLQPLSAQVPPHIPVPVPAPGGVPKSVVTCAQITLADNLLVGLKHPPRILRKPSTGVKSRTELKIRVPVTMQLRSVYSSRMFVTVSVGQTDTGAQKNASILWQGKVRYLDVQVDAGQSVDIPFLAVLPGNGVFDMNCFSITACTAPTYAHLSAPVGSFRSGAGAGTALGPPMFYKPLQQPSMLTVL